MITIVGPDWPSTRKLREACKIANAGARDVMVSFGATRDGALNGMPRLDGIKQLQALRAARVLCPDHTLELDEARMWLTQQHLVFGRKLVHSQGRDIVGPRHPRWARSEWWSKVVPDIEQEWRIHIFKRPTGKYVSIARGLKHQVDEPWRKMPVRNRANGWHMRHDVDPPDKVREAARAAVQAVGYDFGAVDLLLDKTGSVWTLEINSAPGLDDYTCAKYVDAIVRWTN